jgi:bifunctional N-acetylglucosamine-1-phosphate-uridyltransferase/glucosamine-1-phosphate-acetyltransferase GlmU-like protein
MSQPLIPLSSYIVNALTTFPLLASYEAPWSMVAHTTDLVRAMLPTLGPEFAMVSEVAVHHAAVVEAGAVIRAPAIVSRGCVVAAHAYLRGGVFLDEGVRIGPSCEVKGSFVFRGSALAHLNYVGDSLIGADVNLEAGAVIANHFNERSDKQISVAIGERVVPIGVEKFGALLGDGARIGANAVTTPGTILAPRSIVGRLALVDQVADLEARRRDVYPRDSR